jgi:membrane-associated phospholipid phosphatase
MFLKKRYHSLRLRLVDICSLAYLAAIGFLLLFFHRHVPDWPLLFLIRLLSVIAVLEIIRAAAKNPAAKFFPTLRVVYPVAIILYGALEISYTQQLFFATPWAADLLADWDKALFGTHPTVWVQQFYSPGLDELMNFFYNLYFLFIPIVLTALLWQGKKEEALAAISIACFNYFLNYFLFYLIPALSPRMIPWLSALHSKDFTGFFFASITRLYQGEQGVMKGGCFPSVHVSAALSWSIAAWRYERKLGYLFFPMTLGVAVSTFYLRYHHAVDPLAGLLLGAVCSALAIRILKKRREDPL